MLISEYILPVSQLFQGAACDYCYYSLYFYLKSGKPQESNAVANAPTTNTLIHNNA